MSSLFLQTTPWATQGSPPMPSMAEAWLLQAHFMERSYLCMFLKENDVALPEGSRHSKSIPSFRNATRSSAALLWG